MKVSLLKKLKADARKILSVLGSDGAELSVSVVRDAEMARLNWAAVRHRGTTDVLSFPSLDLFRPAKADGLKDGRRALSAAGAALRKSARQSAPLPLVLGDTVICLPQALRQAKEQGHSPSMELRRLLVHSVAHLCGFDHERGPRSERAMNAFEDALLARLRAP